MVFFLLFGLKLVYFAQNHGMRYNPVIIKFVERLRKRGKHTMVIIGAVMRKLLHIAYGVLKNKAVFDPEYQH